MNTRFFLHVRNGLLALGVAAGLAVPAAATPLAGASRASVAPAIADASSDVVQVKHRRYRCFDGWCGGRYGGRYWDDGWRYRRHYRPYRQFYPGLYLGLGVPAYRYYVQPRRYYRRGLNPAHIAWCYDRYRSYREWDNTFKPYHGPRRQCWSPYS